MVSGVIFDKLFNGKRAPVAAPLFLFQAVLIEVAQLMSSGKIGTTLQVSVTVPMGIHVGCDATHSRLGTGVGKGLGGRKMAGFSSGVIDSFQYFGAGYRPS